MATNNNWGFGPARLVKPSTTEETETVVFLSDLHYPFQDDAVIASSLKLIRNIKPHRVVLNGDINDFFQLSRFNTALERLDDLQDEIDQANKLRQSIRKALPNATIDETTGNHDDRIISYVAKNARSLTSLRALEPKNLFMYDALNINHHPGCGFLLRKNFLVKHGTIVRGEAGATAKAELLQAGVSGLSGHTHRLSKYLKVGYDTKEWTEQGCMCRLDPDYVVGKPNWVQGIVVGQFSTKTSNFMVQLVEFKDGKLWYGNKQY
jgi:hypothetical protein